jgi:fluoride ion exporter CrcB/FEX
MTRLKNIKVGAFNKLITPLPGLRQLELQSFPTGLGEQGLARLLMGCRNTLQYAGLPYGTAAVNHSAMMVLGTMPDLTSLHLGSPQERLTLSRSLIGNATTTGGPSKLSGVKSMFKEMLKKKHISKLINLTLYECDEPVMALVAQVAS